MRTPEFLRKVIEWAVKRSDLYQKCEAARKHEYAMNAEYNADLNRILDNVKGEHTGLKKTYAAALRKRNAEMERAEAATALWNTAEKLLSRSKVQCRTAEGHFHAAEEKIQTLKARIEEFQTKGGPIVDMIAGADVDLRGDHFKAAYMEPALQSIFQQVRAETRKRANG